MLPLEGIKVLDLTRLLPGEYCTQVLADFGAEVIKVEDTARGDYSRWQHPLFSDTMIDDTMSAYFVVLNRNKKGIKLNLKEPAGKEIFLKLAKNADVVVESFRPGTMDKLGVGYEDLKKINPGIIYCAITGYGQDGPYRDMAGHDMNYLALAGVLGIQGLKDGPPILSGVQIADVGAGALMSISGILLALMARSETRKGQMVDISMLDGVVTWLSCHAGNFFGNGKQPMRQGTELNGGYACYNVYRAADGKYVALGALEEKFWEVFCNAVERPELIPEQLADSNKQAELKKILQEIFEQKTSDEWIEFFKNYDTCITKVNDFKEAFSDPQVIYRKMVQDYIYKDKAGEEKKIKQLGFPIKLSETPGEIRMRPPKYGEHTEEILANLGYSDKEIKELFRKGVC